MAIREVLSTKIRLDKKLIRQINPLLLKVIELHNWYVELYKPGIKTDETLKSIVIENKKRNDFYKNKGIVDIVSHCLQIQSEMSDVLKKIHRTEELEQLNSFWKNLRANTSAALALTLACVILLVTGCR